MEFDKQTSHDNARTFKYDIGRRKRVIAQT